MLRIHQFLLTTLFVTGQIAFINPSYAGPDNSITAPTQSPVDNSRSQSDLNTSQPGASFDANFDVDTGTFSVEGVGGTTEISLSPEIIQSIEDVSGVSSVESAIDTSSSNLTPAGSDNLTICFSGPCTPSGESTKAVTLKELTALVEEDLQTSLDNLALAEERQRIADSQPRKFSRRRSVTCGCDSVAQAREEVATKLAESEKLIELMERLDPQNSKW